LKIEEKETSVDFSLQVLFLHSHNLLSHQNSIYVTVLLQGYHLFELQSPCTLL